MSSPERLIEESLIAKLVTLKYEYRADIRDRAALEANTTRINTPKPPDSHTNTLPHNRPLRNSTPTPSTPKGTYTQDDTGSQRNNSQWPSTHTSTQSSPPQTTWLPYAPSTPAKSGT